MTKILLRNSAEVLERVQAGLINSTAGQAKRDFTSIPFLQKIPFNAKKDFLQFDSNLEKSTAETQFVC